jgi:phosphatidylglycerol:prolipoprotein diacylglycerol transferase
VPRCAAEYFEAWRTAAGSRFPARTFTTAKNRKQKVRVDLTRSETLPRARVARQIFLLSIIRCLIYPAALLAYYLDNFSPFIVKFGPSFGIRWYGFSYLLAFFCGFLLLRWLAQRHYCALPPDKVADFILVAALGVIVGGRLGYVLFYRLGQLLVDPLFVFRIWDGGMSSHGGMIGLTLAVFFYGRRHHVPWLSLADNIAVVAPVGLFLGRCANFINGELYGRAATVAWAMQFPKEALDLPEVGARTLAAAHVAQPAIGNLEVIIEQARTNLSLQSVLRQTLTPRHPSQLYEALLEGALLFGCLWFLRICTRQPRGMLAGIFLLLYALVRVMVENFREPDAPLTGPFTRGQTLSVLLVAGGICFVVYALKTKDYEAAQRG